MTIADGHRTDARPVRTSTFASLQVATYRLLFVSGTISFLAVQVQMVARGWLANDLSGSNTGLGGVYMAFGVPMLVATPFGGVLADRVSKRNILLVTQVAMTLSAAWIGFGVVFDFVEYWMLLVTSAIQAVSFSFLGPARMAMTSELVGRHLLPNAIVLGQMSLNSARVFGPALAGIAIGVSSFGTAGVYFASAVLSVVAFFAVMPLPSARTVKVGPPRSPRREFMDGLAYVRGQREVRLLLVVSFLVVMVAFPYIAFLPRVATVLFDVGASGYGALSAASAVGALSVSLVIARRASPREAWVVQTMAGLAFGVALVLLAVAPGFVLALLAVAGIGAAASAFQSMNNTLVLALSEFEYHGRIQSLMMLSFSGFGMAALPLGGIADAVGLRETFAGMGLVCLAAMGVYLLVRRRGGARLEPALG